MIMDVFEELNKLYEEDATNNNSIENIISKKVDELYSDGIESDELASNLLDGIRRTLKENSPLKNQFLVSDVDNLVEFCRRIAEVGTAAIDKDILSNNEVLYSFFNYYYFGDSEFKIILGINTWPNDAKQLVPEAIKSPQWFLSELRKDPRKLADEFVLYVQAVDLSTGAAFGGDIDYPVEYAYQAYEALKDSGKFSAKSLANIKAGIDAEAADPAINPILQQIKQQLNN